MFAEKETVAVIGLGYVGLPLAVAFAKKMPVIGFDLKEDKIEAYRNGKDLTQEVGDETLLKTNIRFTSDEMDISKAKYFIVAVPTPINAHNSPDISSLISASDIVGRNMRKGSIVVYESTVYPGLTEETCIPILEKVSNMRCGVDFKVGYSPERINPGDKQHRLETIKKIVSGMDNESLELIAALYEQIIDAGVYRVSSIRVAEAAKVIENSQRDINIAFVNELSIIFSKMGIDTLEVLEAAATKWNFLSFKPGLVGGHCIGVDPYYLTYKAQELGYHPEVILSGRRINDYMGRYVAESLVKLMIKNNYQVHDANILILGITFKENVPDSRNTRVVDIINELKDYGTNVYVCDPCADAKEVEHIYGVSLTTYDDIPLCDAVVVAVPHSEFKKIGPEALKKKLKHDRKILVDIKGMYNRKEMLNNGFLYWSL